MLRSHITPEFRADFKEGVDHYLAGEWSGAKPMFEKCNTYMAAIPGMGGVGDGPSMTLLSYMSTFEFVAPENWKGYRPLTAK